MSEFGLVCDRYVLVSLSQTILVLGQAFGAFGSSIISDRFGRKPVLIGSQLGLLIGGVIIGAAPVYSVLVLFKFFVGACQQGVVATISTMGIELYPRQYRSLSALIIAVWWAVGGTSMALYAYFLQHHSWRLLQYSMSCISLLVVLLQLLLMEESIRWLAANGRKKEVLRVLKRAALTNRKIVGQVLATLHQCQQQGLHRALTQEDAILRSVEHLFPPATHRPVSLVIEKRNWQDPNDGGEEEESSVTGSRGTMKGNGAAGREEPVARATQWTTYCSREDSEKEDESSTETSKNSDSEGHDGLSAQTVDAGEKGLKASVVGNASATEKRLNTRDDCIGMKGLSTYTAEDNSTGEKGLGFEERTARPKGLSCDTVEDDSATEHGLGARAVEDASTGETGFRVVQGHSRPGAVADVEEKELNLEATRQLTLLDLCRNRTMRFNALLTFFAWFTVAFVVFTLFLMSTSYAGNPYLNYFLTALMELPPAFILYFGVDRLGRKLTVQGLFAVAGVGCLASAVCLMFPGDVTSARMSSVFAMAGTLGGSGAFSGLFFYTPEYYPTNLRNQALGTGSSVGRIGGMIAPFMKNLAVRAMWGPGIISGCLCVLVVMCLYFLPETKGRELPNTIEDIEAWYSGNKKCRSAVAPIN